MMSITQARSSLAEAVNHVRVKKDPVYLTRRNAPVAVIVDIDHYEALQRAEKALAELSQQSPSSSIETREIERLRRMAAMAKTAAPFMAWVKPGTSHPDSASDLYAQRTVDV